MSITVWLRSRVWNSRILPALRLGKQLLTTVMTPLVSVIRVTTSPDVTDS